MRRRHGALVSVAVLLASLMGHAPAYADAKIVSCTNQVSSWDGTQTNAYCLYSDGKSRWTVIVTTVPPEKNGSTPLSTPTCTTDCPPVLNYGSSCQGIPLAQWAGCTGASTTPACPPGQARYNSFEVGANGNLQLIDTFCQNPGTNPVPPQFYVSQYVNAFTPDPAIGTLYPTPGNPLPITLDLFVAATSPPQQVGHVGPAAANIAVHYDQPEYTWNFGDGYVYGPNSSTGGKYPTGNIHHPYKIAKDYTVTLHVSWRVTYDYTLAGVARTGLLFGRIGQLPDQTFRAHIVEAHAVLTN